MEKISKREQKKRENIKQENIKKFQEEYEKNKKVSEEYKRSIKNRVIKNTIIAVLSIIYLILINVLSVKIETILYISIIKYFCMFLGIVSVVFFEMSYRKDNGFIFLQGVEFFMLATITLFSIYAYSIFYGTYNKILLSILIGVVVYFIIKTICTIVGMKREYIKKQNDIKDIVV